MTVEALAVKIGTSKGHLSNVEQFKTTLTEDFRNAAAEALKTDPNSLLMIDPTAGEPIWALWEKANPAQRETIVKLARALVVGPFEISIWRLNQHQVVESEK